MTAEQLIDRLADALQVPAGASKLTIERDWQSNTLKVIVELKSKQVSTDQADQIVRAAQDFTLKELSEFRDAIEIQTGS